MDPPLWAWLSPLVQATEAKDTAGVSGLPAVTGGCGGCGKLTPAVPACLAQEEHKQKERLAADERRAVKAADALLSQEHAEAQQKEQKVCALLHPSGAA